MGITGLTTEIIWAAAHVRQHNRRDFDPTHQRVVFRKCTIAIMPAGKTVFLTMPREHSLGPFDDLSAASSRPAAQEVSSMYF